MIAAGPHAVAEALAAPDIEVLRVYIEEGAGGRGRSVGAAAKLREVPVSSAGSGECDRLAGVRCQGVAAEILFSYTDFHDVLERDGLIVFLDEVTDPHNLGAVIRTAEAAGAVAVVVLARRGAQVTPAVMRVSAGAAVHMPICVVKNLARALEAARKAGFWLIGLDHAAERELEAVPGRSRVGLVVGGEGAGLRSLVARGCDEIARLPMAGRVESLNASVAAGIAIYRLSPVLRGPDGSVDSTGSG